MNLNNKEDESREPSEVKTTQASTTTLQEKEKPETFEEMFTTFQKIMSEDLDS